MEIAQQQAKLAFDKGNIPIGACIVLNDQVIAKAHNEVDSNCNDLLHAELAAISQVTSILFENKGQATIYTTLEPCAMCAGAIVNTGIKNIVYASKDRYVGALEPLQSLNYYQYKLSHVKSGILADQAQTLLNEYVDKNNYRVHLKQP